MKSFKLRKNRIKKKLSDFEKAQLTRSFLSGIGKGKRMENGVKKSGGVEEEKIVLLDVGGRRRKKGRKKGRKIGRKKRE